MGTLNITQLPASIATKKISELPAAETLTGSEVAPVIQEGETRKTDEIGGGGGGFPKIAQCRCNDLALNKLRAGSVGVASLVRTGTGVYVVTFTNGFFPTVVPACVATVEEGDDAGEYANVEISAVNEVMVRVFNSSFSPTNASFALIAIGEVV